MQQNLDRIIDQAARQIMGREPSDALSSAVMAAIADRRSPIDDRRLAWAVAGAGAVACGLAVLLMLNRAPQLTEAPRPPAATAAPAAERVPVPTLPASNNLSGEPSEPAVQVVRRVRRIVAPPIPPEDEIVGGVNPIAVESISLDPIEVPPVQAVAVDPIDQIDVEPLIVEPLSTANN